MKTKLNKIANDTNIFLKNFLNKQNNSKLLPAMKYGLFPGGKKIRSKILVDIGSLLSIDYRTLISIGAAVECIHAYSLIHDDLPCIVYVIISRGNRSTQGVSSAASDVYKRQLQAYLYYYQVVNFYLSYNNNY